MKLAFISDIHANLEALTAVLEDIEKRGVDQLICLGDIVGYGPSPKDCLNVIKNSVQSIRGEIREPRSERCAPGCIKPILRGNHDEHEYHTFDMDKWSRKQLSSEERLWLKALPISMRIGSKHYDGERSILLAHGEWTEPHKFKYLYPYGENGLLQANLDRMEERDILFCGHTHIQAIYNKGMWDVPPIDQEAECQEAEYILQRDGKVIVNVGSVGQPRMQGDDKAGCAIYDTRTDRVTLRRVKYDYDTTREKIMAIREVSEKTRAELALSLGSYKGK